MTISSTPNAESRDPATGDPCTPPRAEEAPVIATSEPAKRRRATRHTAPATRVEGAARVGGVELGSAFGQVAEPRNVKRSLNTIGDARDRQVDPELLRSF